MLRKKIFLTPKQKRPLRDASAKGGHHE